MSRKIYTTGMIAKICKVAPRTVSKWFDSGQLRGYRIPGGQGGDRRVTRDSLLEFLKAHGMPVEEVVGGDLRHVLLVAVPDDFHRELALRLNPDSGFKLEAVPDLFTAGMVFQDGHFRVVVFWRTVGRDSVAAAVPSVHGRNGGYRSQVIYLADEDVSVEYAHRTFVHGGGIVMQAPYDRDLVVAAIADATETSEGMASWRSENGSRRGKDGRGRRSRTFCPAGHEPGEGGKNLDGQEPAA